jgi:hypothetical protein
MKLEIKHLAPYLPYGLNGIYKLSDVINLLDGQKDEIRDKKLASDCVPFFLSYCKPILRPLSDLTKQISDNKGRKFILAKQLWSVSENDEDVFELFGTLPEYWDISLRALISDYRNVDYGDIQKMLKYHFDIFGLIDQGLAIDINTLDK